MSDQWMGSLAAQDQYRPLGNDPWTNTMRGTVPAPGQGFAASADPVLYPTASPLVSITEGDIKRATEVGLAASGGGIKGQQIKAYHSSPHDFDKFDLAKIGTGEGAQVYGHGLYFAENPAVSGRGGQYWNQFMRKFEGPEEQAAQYLSMANFDRAQAIKTVGDQLERNRQFFKTNPHEVDPARQARLEESFKILQSDKPVGPRTYEVNIKADPAHMLDWDKPLRAQPHIQDVLADKMLADLPGKAGIRNIRRVNEEIDEILGSKSGDILYRKFSTNPREASAALREAGIPGIKYLDQGSRNAQPILKTTSAGDIISSHYPPPTSNYVIFDPSIVDIMKKYGIASAAPAGMGALAAQDQYNVQ